MTRINTNLNADPSPLKLRRDRDAEAQRKTKAEPLIDNDKADFETGFNAKTRRRQRRKHCGFEHEATPMDREFASSASYGRGGGLFSQRNVFQGNRSAKRWFRDGGDARLSP